MSMMASGGGGYGDSRAAAAAAPQGAVAGTDAVLQLTVDAAIDMGTYSGVGGCSGSQ